MSRTLTSGMQAMAAAKVSRPIFLVRMVFDTAESPNELNVWTGMGDLTYDSETYTGLGDLLSISEIKETSDVSATGINVALTGVKSSLIAVAKNHEYQGRELTVRLGAFDDSGSLRSSTGLGIDLFTPIGPLNFSFAQDLTKHKNDTTETFRFNLGTTF